MRPFLFALVVLTLLGTAPVPSDVTVRKLSGPLYLIEDKYIFQENSVFYVGPSYVTIIGTGWSPDVARLIHEQIRKVTSKPVREVVDTDYNWERAGGNSYWHKMGAAVISTKLTATLLRRDWAAIGAMTRAAFPDLPNVPLSMPTRTYAGSFTLQHGAIRALYLGPSHTPDDIFVYFPNQRVLYGGNALKEHAGNLALANLRTYRKTLLRLKSLDLPIRMIIAGHWSAIHGPDLIDIYLGFLAKAARGERV